MRHMDGPVKLASDILRAPGIGFLTSVDVSTLPWGEAWDAVRAANVRREAFREKPHDPKFVSPMEVALYAAFLYYDMAPALQMPIGWYDADFLFEDVELVVEVDGKAYHQLREDWRDDHRDKFMRSGGYEVRRFGGRSVWRDPLQCAREVQRSLERMRQAA